MDNRTVLNGNFILIDNFTAVCKICNKQYVYHRSYSSLKYHLCAKHPELLPSFSTKTKKTITKISPLSSNNNNKSMAAKMKSSGFMMPSSNPLEPSNSTLNPLQHSMPTTSEITFMSRILDSNGNVKMFKEFLCNFCPFKTGDKSEYDSHVTIHMFSCNHCNFQCFCRLFVLKHKKEMHSEASEELAGYGELDKLIDVINRSSSSSPLPSSLSLSEMTTDIKIEQAFFE